jgi:hypothetical protein
MAIKPASPRITISEIDKTAVVPGVGASGGAFVGNFRWGPVEQRTLVADEAGLIEAFAEPDNNNTKDWHSAAYFLKYSQTLQIVRMNNGGVNAHSAVTSLSDSANVKNEADWENSVSSAVGEAGTKTGTWIAKYPGSLGNSITVSFCPAGDSSGVDHFTGWAYASQFDAAPGTSAYASARGASNDQIHVVVVDRTGDLSGTPNAVLEKFENLSMAGGAVTADNSPNYVSDILNEQSQYIWNGYFGDDSAFGSSYSNLGGKVGITPSVDSATNFGIGTGLTDAVRTVKLKGGVASSALGTSDFASGFDLFEDRLTTEIDFLVAPAGVGRENHTTVVNDLVSIAAARKDCVITASPPSDDIVGKTASQATSNAVSFANTCTKSSYLILDNNWFKVYDKFNDRYISLPANSSTAGLMANTDVVADPWYSPAGQRRGQYRGVTDILVNPNQTQRDSLYKAGVNPIANIPGTGLVLFGDKTMQANPSAFDRINVRRLFIAIEKSIAIAAKSVMFEFNDEFTRAEFVNIVEPFLRRVRGRRGITDFRVVCDETNNTQEVIDNNQFVASIFVKPARSINFVQLNFVAVRTGVDFEEVVGSVGA